MFKVILVADDDDFIRDVMESCVAGTIKNHRAKVRGNVREPIIVGGVTEALTEVRKLITESPLLEFRIALFTDGTMPEADGLVARKRYGDELIAEMQQLIGRQRMPVTVMIAGDSSRRAAATILGAHFVAKPIEMREIEYWLVPFLEAKFA